MAFEAYSKTGKVWWWMDEWEWMDRWIDRWLYLLREHLLRHHLGSHLLAFYLGSMICLFLGRIFKTEITIACLRMYTKSKNKSEGIKKKKKWRHCNWVWYRLRAPVWLVQLSVILRSVEMHLEKWGKYLSTLPEWASD